MRGRGSDDVTEERDQAPRRPELPYISVVIPVRNGEPWLVKQLAALEAQTYQGQWEVLAVDNGSRDHSRQILGSWREHLPLRVVDAPDRAGINVARNAGCEQAKGELIAFCDADDVAAPHWLTALVAAAQRFDLVGGRLDEEHLNLGYGSALRPRLPADRLPMGLGFLPFALGANFAVWRDVLDRVGVFDEAFILGNDDVEFSFRAQLRGFRLGYAPDAVVAYRHREGSRELFRQFRSYGRSEPLLFKCYGAHGMPPTPFGQVLRRWARLVLFAPSVFASPERRGAWLVSAGFSLGRLEGAVRNRVLYL
ncbi:MAG: glycosyltransferase [Acidimicrobiia bacterium]|nr:glycosyltransferase [Acidimicrobiia bacterium]